MSDIARIGAHLAAARQRAGLTQQELARRAGTSQSSIARIEQGRVNPTFATLERLAEAAGFRLDVEFLPAAGSDPVIEAYKRDIDRTLLRENLRKPVEERIRALADLQAFAGEVRRGGRAAGGAA